MNEAGGHGDDDLGGAGGHGVGLAGELDGEMGLGGGCAVDVDGIIPGGGDDDGCDGAC